MITRNVLLIISVVATFSAARVWTIDSLLPPAEALRKTGGAVSAQVVESVLGRLSPGDALRLSNSVPLGRVTVGAVAENIEVTGGFDGEMRFTGRARNWRFVYAGANTDLIVERGADLSGSTFFCSFSGGDVIDYSSSDYESVGMGLVPAPRTSSLHKVRKAGGCGPGPGIKWGVKTFYFDDYGNRRKWMPVYYVDMAGAPDQTDDAQVEIRNGREGGEWLFAIEANQNAGCVVMRMIDCQRLQLYSGSTEGAGNQTQGIYVMNNCEQVVLGMRRFFSNHRAHSSWQGKPYISLLINQGTGNIIHNLIDIGNPLVNSLISSDPSLQIWQTFFEDAARKAPGTFECGVTYQGMMKKESQWTEPVQVGDEVILRQNGEDRLFAATPDLPAPPAFRNQPWQNGLSKRGAPGAAAAPSRRFREARGFGAALLAAGADPTGRRFADEAFRRVMMTHERVEVPAGRFRLRRPLRIRESGLAKSAGGIDGPQYILGAGPDRTVLEAPSEAEAVLDLRSSGLAKNASVRSGQDLLVIDGIAMRGGECGMIAPAAGMAMVISDFKIEGYAKAGALFESAVGEEAYNVVVPPEGEAGCGDNNQADTHLFSGGSFSGGEYGIYYTGFSDKQGIDGVTFSGHAKAGIASFHSNLFHGWIKGCKFNDITGPGVDLSGGHIMPPGYGSSYYTQWVTMIEGCTFSECGSATRAAVDYGMTDINMLCNSTIRTTGKTIKYGFLGSLAQMSNVDIEVNASRAAVALRHPRATEASRTPMTVIHSVTCNGSLMLVNGLASGQRGLEPVGSEDPLKDFIYSSRLTIDTLGQEFAHSGPKWWKRGAYSWAFPRLLYNSSFGGATYEYVLTNEWGFSRDVRTGEIIDMSGVAYEGWEPAPFPYLTLPIHFDADARIDELPPAKSLPIRNAGLGTLPAASVSTAVSWLDVSVSGAENDQMLSISLNSMPPSGDHRVIVAITAGEFTIAVPVTVHIEDDRRPSKTVIAPRMPLVTYGVPESLSVTVLDQFGDPAEGDYTVEWTAYQPGAEISEAGVLTPGPAPGFFGLTARVAGSAYYDSVTFHSRYVIDNTDDECVAEGDWQIKEACNRYMHCSYGENKLETERMVTHISDGSSASARWTPAQLPAGEYEIFVSINKGIEYYVTVAHTGGNTKINLADRKNEKMRMHAEYDKWYWLSLGTFDLGDGAAVSVTDTDNAHLGRDRLSADAVMFDVPRSGWPAIDTTGEPATRQRVASRTAPIARKPSVVVVFDLRGRRIVKTSADLWRQAARRLPAGRYLCVMYDKKGVVSKSITIAPLLR